MNRNSFITCIATALLTVCSCANTGSAAGREAAPVTGQLLLAEDQQSVWDSKLADRSRFMMNIKPTAEEKKIAKKFSQTFVANLNNSKFFMHYLLTKLQENDLPIELVAIPMIESGMNPNVRPNAGAHGPWQYIRSTGKSLGLKRSQNYDELYDFVRTTDASVSYLKRLYKDLDHNWDMVIAAYNQGEWGVRRAMKQARARGVKVYTANNVKLSKGARRYVKRFHAFADMLKNPKNYGITFPEIKNRPAFKRVQVAGRLNSMKQAAKLSGTSLETLKHLNAGYRTDRLETHGKHGLLVPTEDASRLEKALEQYSKDVSKNAVAGTKTDKKGSDKKGSDKKAM